MSSRVLLTPYNSSSAYKRNLTPGVAALVQVTNFTNSKRLLSPPSILANEPDAATTKSPIPSTNTSTPLPPASPSPSSSHHTSTGTIAGSVIGALVFLALLATSIICFLRRQKAAKATAARKRQISVEVVPYAKIETDWTTELPDVSRGSELNGQARVEMGHGQGKDPWGAVEIGQPATPVLLHEL